MTSITWSLNRLHSPAFLWRPCMEGFILCSSGQRGRDAILHSCSCKTIRCDHDTSQTTATLLHIPYTNRLITLFIHIDIGIPLLHKIRTHTISSIRKINLIPCLSFSFFSSSSHWYQSQPSDPTGRPPLNYTHTEPPSNAEKLESIQRDKKKT
jgi:hypothetical protein